MKKENYFVNQNKNEKIIEWKRELSKYYSLKKKFKFDIERAILVINDMQEFFLNPNSHAFLPSAKTIIEPIKKLQGFFREKKRRVVFTKFGLKRGEKSIMSKWWGNELQKGSALAMISNDFDISDDLVIEKTTYDAFHETNLLETISESQSTMLVLVGIATHLCCETTARTAFCHNLEVYLPIDCLASFTEELHLNSLKSASHGFGIPITSDDILEKK